MLSSRLYCVNGLTFTQRVLNTKYECAQFSGSYFSENAVVKLFLTPIVYNVCVQTKHLCNVSIILLAALFFNPFRPVIKNKCTVWRRQSLFQGGGGVEICLAVSFTISWPFLVLTIGPKICKIFVGVLSILI